MKFSLRIVTEQDMQDYINSQNTSKHFSTCTYQKTCTKLIFGVFVPFPFLLLDFSISLDIPHISQMIESPTLKITHKLRLNIRFMDSTKERAMSLSFPLHICTVPKAESTAWNPERISVDNYLERDVSLTYPDLLLMTSEESAQRAQFSEDEYNKLPSYREALHEGAPPSPFLEDNI
jgi:hypothetical protein